MDAPSSTRCSESQSSDGLSVRISVIVEGWNESHTGGRDDCFELEATLTALRRQDFPVGSVEVLLAGSPAQVEKWRRRFPQASPFAALRFVTLHEDNHYALKNAGATKARAERLAFCDSDTVPCPTWLLAIDGAFDEGADLVVGPSVFRRIGEAGGEAWAMQVTASIGKGWVVGAWREGSPTAAGMHAHNFAVRKELFSQHCFRTDLGRTLAAPLLFRRWMETGAQASLVPDMQVAHAFTWRWWLHHYHFRLGYEVYQLMRLDPTFGHRWVRRTGLAQPLFHFLLYTVGDLPRWWRYSRALGLSSIHRVGLLPLLALLSVVARGAESAGMCATMINPARMQAWAETA